MGESEVQERKLDRVVQTESGKKGRQTVRQERKPRVDKQCVRERERESAVCSVIVTLLDCRMHCTEVVDAGSEDGLARAHTTRLGARCRRANGRRVVPLTAYLLPCRLTTDRH